MKTVFLDTSALVKIYAVEPGSTEVRGLFREAVADDPSVTLVVCDQSEVEAYSALARKERDGDITTAEADAFIERMGQHFSAESSPFLIIAGSSVQADAGPFTRQYGLKAADAIQLAAALAARHTAPPDTDFLFGCTDTKLCAAARAENFTVLLPGGAPAGGSDG